MHQNQWLAAWEELGGPENHPIPNSFPQEDEHQDFNYTFLTFGADGVPQPEGRWSEGRSFDGRAEFAMRAMEPLGEKPDLGPAAPEGAVQISQMQLKKAKVKSKR